MKPLEIYKDILHYRTQSQAMYNEYMMTARNPEVRRLFARLRDDETEAVITLQEKIDGIEAPPGIITKILPAKGKKEEF